MNSPTIQISSSESLKDDPVNAAVAERLRDVLIKEGAKILLTILPGGLMDRRYMRLCLLVDFLATHKGFCCWLGEAAATSIG